MPALYMPHMGAHLPTVAPGARPRINPRTGRGVAALSPDTAAIGAPSPYAVYPQFTQPLTPATPGAIPPKRLGTVGKLAAGKMGHGQRPALGMLPMAGGQSGALITNTYPVLENAPATVANFRLQIPQNTPSAPGAVRTGRALAPTYRAKDFAPAQRFFNQARSARPWAQSQYPPTPGGRPLVPSVQPQTLARMTMIRRQIPAAQVNSALYAAGYPTRASVASRLGGGGPVAVLGGMT